MAIQSFIYDNFLGGPNLHASPLLMQRNELKELNGGVLGHILGAICKDPGYEAVNASGLASGKPVREIFDFKQDTSTQKQLFTSNNSGDTATELYYDGGSSYTEITDAETAWTVADVDVDMATFIGYCFMVGANASGSFITTGSLTDTTFSTSDNVTNAPQGKFVEVYDGQVWIANVKVGSDLYPYRAYHSSYPTAGAITWDTSSTSVDFQDFDLGEDLTGLKAKWGKLWFFTAKHTSYYDGSVKRVAYWSEGCENFKTIQEVGEYLFFVNRKGLYYSYNGAAPKNLSGKIRDLIKNADLSVMRSASTDEEYHLYVGSTSANGIAFSNVLITLNVADSTFRWRELGHSMSEIGAVDIDGVDRLYLGRSNGQVYDKSFLSDSSPVWNDAGEAIKSRVLTTIDHLGDPSKLKTLAAVHPFAERAVGAQLRYRVVSHQDEALSEWMDVGELRSFVQHFSAFMKKPGYFIQFELSDYSKNPGFIFYGLQVDYEFTAIPKDTE